MNAPALTGQAFWRRAEQAAPLALPDCPCCGRPMPIGRGVLEHALTVAEATWGVGPAAIMGPSRTTPISKARALAVWAMRSLGEGLSYEAIARKLGRMHHSSVMALHQKAIAARLADPQFAQACGRVIAAVTATKGERA